MSVLSSPPCSGRWETCPADYCEGGPEAHDARVRALAVGSAIDVQRLARAIGLVAGFVDVDYAADVAQQYARLAAEEAES